MTEREAAIVTAFTGYFIGDAAEFHRYAEHLMKRPVFTHELATLEAELHTRSLKDFIELEVK